MKKGLCITLSVLLVLLTASCAITSPPDYSEPTVKEPQPEFTALPNHLYKREMVFASLAPSGDVLGISVTDRLTTDKSQVMVRDKSFLTSIQNLKGDEVPNRTGTDIVWHMQNTDLYYSGETKKNLPVNLHIRYFRNGQEVSGGSLKGKNGQFKIICTADNTQYKETEDGRLYTPFLLVGGAVLSGNVQNLSVSAGTHFGDGNQEYILGMLLPGVSESLHLNENDNLIPQSITISFQTKSFSLEDLYFVLLPLSTVRLGEAVRSVFGDVNFPKSDFSDLLETAETFGNDSSMQSFLASAAENAELFRTIGMAMQSFSKVEPLLTVLTKYLTNENLELLQDTLDRLSGTTLGAYAELLQNPAFLALLTDMGTVSDAYANLLPVLSSFIAELSREDVQSSVHELPTLLQSLTSLSSVISENEAWFDSIENLMQSSALQNFSDLLQSVQSLLQNGTIEAIANLAGNAGELSEKIEELLEEGEKYSIFTLSPKDAVSSVYFVLRVRL